MFEISSKWFASLKSVLPSLLNPVRLIFLWFLFKKKVPAYNYPTDTGLQPTAMLTLFKSITCDFKDHLIIKP